MTPQTKITKLGKMLEVIDANLSREEFVNTVENVLKRLLKIEQENAGIIEGLKITIDGIKIHLKNATDSDLGKLRAQIRSDIGMLTSKLEEKSKAIDQKMALIKDGIDGKDADEQRVVQQVLALIKLPEYRAPVMPGPEETRDMLELLQDENRLDKSAVKGIEAIEEKVKEISLRPVGRGGGAKGIGLYIGGSKKLLTAQQINIIGGTGISVSYAHANGRNDITITATGSASLTPITITGTIDNSNVDFTAASEPSLVIVNGAAYRHGAGVTISGTTITLDNPVGSGGDVYGL